MAEILLVDDERVIRDGIKAMLSAEGYSVRVAKDGDSALKKFREQLPDLVILDVMMPGINGFRVCEAIREMNKEVPILFLTAKDSDVDEIRGIGAGADDFISKSSDSAVLLTRVRRALERHQLFSSSSAAGGDSRCLTMGKVVVDFQRNSVVGGAADHLTSTEAEILKLLSSHRGQPFSIDEIIVALRGNGFACEDSMLYSHISNLRRKLGEAGGRIVCNRSIGYSFT